MKTRLHLRLICMKVQLVSDLETHTIVLYILSRILRPGPLSNLHLFHFAYMAVKISEIKPSHGLLVLLIPNPFYAQ